MQAKVTSVQGIDDAIISMFISKHTLTPELEQEIREVVERVTYRDGSIILTDTDDCKKYVEWMDRLLKWGKRHITMIKFIDIRCMVYGLHRAGQDDVDAHAKRMDNRIIRNSSRIAGIKDESKLQNLSVYYEDKVLTTDAALKLLDMELPAEIEKDGVKFVRTFNGYIREDVKDSQDVKRGLYNLGFPSDFIFAINLAEFAHFYQERGQHGAANPEVKMCAEVLASSLQTFYEGFDRDFLLNVRN